MGRGRKPIDPARDRETILDHATRRAIARRCRREPKTARDLAVELGRSVAEIRSVSESLREWGVLQEVRSADGDARLYVLSDDWRGDVSAAMRRHAPAFVGGQRAVLVRPQSVQAAARRLKDYVADEVSGAIPFEDGRGLLLTLDELTDDARAQQIVAGLELGPGEAELVTVAEPIRGDAVAAYARSITP